MRGICTVEVMEQERATEGGLHTAIPGDGGYESGRVEEEVWKCARRKRGSCADWGDECGPEVVGEGRCSHLYAKSGRFVVFRNIVFQIDFFL